MYFKCGCDSLVLPSTTCQLSSAIGLAYVSKGYKADGICFRYVFLLQGLGMDTLKTKLQNAGLKCGGSLSERAARLYLLKELTLEQIDKKHLAKTGSMGAKK